MALAPDSSFSFLHLPLHLRPLEFTAWMAMIINWSVCYFKPLLTLFPKSQAQSTTLLIKNYHLKKAQTEDDIWSLHIWHFNFIPSSIHQVTLCWNHTGLLAPHALSCAFLCTVCLLHFSCFQVWNKHVSQLCKSLPGFIKKSIFFGKPSGIFHVIVNYSFFYISIKVNLCSHCSTY